MATPDETGFDWQAVCEAVVATGACVTAMAGDSQGNVFASYPLADDGNFKFWVFGDPYKALVTKNDGKEVVEEVYEAYNLALLVNGQKGAIPDGHGVRFGGEKFMHLRILKGETYTARVKDAEGVEGAYPVTIDEVHVLKKGPLGLFVGVKGGYWIVITHNSADQLKQAPSMALAAMAIGFYWAVGGDS